VLAIAATACWSEAKVSKAIGDKPQGQDNDSTTVGNVTNATWTLTTENVTPEDTPTWGVTRVACSACCATGALYECRVCPMGTCPSCARGLQCSRYYRGVSDHKTGVGNGAEFAVQHQSWRIFRNGTVAQKKVGLSTLVEYCGEPNSLMSELWQAQGGAAHRLGFAEDGLRVRRRAAKAGDLLEQAARPRAGRADVLWGSLLCSPWTALQHFMKNNTQLAVGRAESRQMVKLFTKEAQRELEVGVIVAFEWPVICHGGKQPEVQVLERILPYECLFDGCAYGLMDDRTGKTIEQPWKVITNHRPLQKLLNRRCSQDQERLQGREFNRRTSKETGLYTKELCGAAIRGFMRGIADVNYALVTLLSDVENEGADKEPQGILASLESEQRLTLTRAVAKMRANLGHPGNRGTDMVFLNQIDMVVVPATSRNPANRPTPGCSRSAFRTSRWRTSEVLEREVKEELETMGSRIVSSALYSPTQNAICERHDQTGMAHARPLISELFLAFKEADQVKWLMAAINYAVNSAVGTLHQRVLDDDEPSFRQRVGLLSAAKRSVATFDAHNMISEAFLAKGRLQLRRQRLRRTGDQVHDCRGLGEARAKKHLAARWHGPAVAIGHESNSAWLAHRNLTIKASARHVRAAGASELVDWKGVSK
ncbi:unnamed protein product, partial [Prorocentrum cordatum]